MLKFFRSLRESAGQPAVREFLLWCLPALLAGLVLRAVLTAQMPMGVYHFDSPDFLTTPDRLLFAHKWELHMKKTFLVPVLFTIPFLLHLPALVFLPLMQHAMGLGCIVLTGALCRLWFARWKLFIVPLTLIVAVNPYMLWYEHVLMAETTYVFCTLLLALAGTLYTLRPDWRRFAFLCGALVLEAGARPEGKLLFGFALLLLGLLHARQWRVEWPRLVLMLVLAVTMHFLTKTSQAGLLLYTSVARLTPDHLKAAPGFEPYIAPLRQELRERWEDYFDFPHVRDRRKVAEAVEAYLKENNTARGHGHGHLSVNELCLKLASETCRRNLAALPVLAYWKFRYTAWDEPSGLLDTTDERHEESGDDWLWSRQKSAYVSALDRSTRLSELLSGQALTKAEDFEPFLKAHYRSVGWFNRWNDGWTAAVNRVRFRDIHYTEQNGKPLILFGIPAYFLVAGVGVVVAFFRRGPLQPMQVAWGLAMLGLFFTIILTANQKPRFRFVFEPFWYIYMALLLDTVLLWLQGLTERRPAPVREEAVV